MRIHPAIMLLLCVAATFNATYDIAGEDVHVTYDIDTEEGIDLIVPSDARLVTVDGETEHKAMSIEPGRHTVTFITRSVLERTDDNHLVADLSPIQADIGTVTVLIPTEARLARGLQEARPSIHPPPSSASTDGKRLIFEWQGEDLEPSRAVLVTYSLPDGQGWMVTAALAVLVAGLIVALIGRRFMASSDRLTQNLYSDEKKLVQTLREHGGELWQKELQERSGMTKVKVSRKVRALEAKGVVEKIPYGNTNKIRIKRS